MIWCGSYHLAFDMEACDESANRNYITNLSFSAKIDEPLSIRSRRSLSTAFFRIITFSINSYKDSLQYVLN